MENKFETLYWKTGTLHIITLPSPLSDFPLSCQCIFQIFKSGKWNFVKQSQTTQGKEPLPAWKLVTCPDSCLTWSLSIKSLNAHLT